ncbi:hypothetical protein ACG873_02895 [Mesorhizobium sp. AaZ16]|uniref:hypothetical protein n=1 Tax=Mesorhizobium sp. AaZ16 TaxID=3402289 RepID=UPI00374F7963
MNQKTCGPNAVARALISWLLVGVMTTLLPNSARAEIDCNLSNFDQTDPIKVFGSKKSSDGEFSYASDLDDVNGTLVARNYVKNESAAVGLSFRWEGTTLSHHPAKPLPPGEVACNEFPARNSTMQVDDSSPIYHGPNDTEQPASVYVWSNGSGVAEESSNSILKSSFINSEGKRETFEVSVSYAVSENIVKSIDIETSGNVVATLSAEKKFWSSSTIEDFLTNAASSGVEAGVSDAIKFADLSAEDSGAFYAAGSSVLFYLSGRAGGFGTGAKSYGSLNVRVAVFDLQRQPIAVGTVALPFTNAD